jgi:hypothetical protein
MMGELHRLSDRKIATLADDMSATATINERFMAAEIRDARKALADAADRERARCAEIARTADLAPDTVSGTRQRALRERIACAIEGKPLPEWPVR